MEIRFFVLKSKKEKVLDEVRRVFNVKTAAQKVWVHSVFSLNNNAASYPKVFKYKSERI